MNAAEFVDRLQGVQRNGHGWKARCPAHADREASLSVHEGDDGRILLKCFAGCDIERIVSAVGLQTRDLFASSNGRGGGGGIPSSNTATLQRSKPTGGLTLAQYAAAKQLPLKFLVGLGLADCNYLSQHAVRIPYLGADGAEVAVRFRLRLTKGEGGDGRFAWKKGTKAQPYGLWRLTDAIKAGYIIQIGRAHV